MKSIKKISLFGAFLVTMFLSCLTQSCKENIDMSDQFTFKDETIVSYLGQRDTTYSEYLQLLQDTKISGRSKSSVYQLLSARGKYTVFAPTNKAIYDYLDTLYQKGIINQPNWDGFTDENVLDSIRQVIVFNSILDGTKDEIEPVQSSSFPEDMRDFDIPNMFDRKLTICINDNAPDSVYINGERDTLATGVINYTGSLVDLKNRDIYTINGYIHQVHSVIAPSNETLGDLLRSYIEEGKGKFIVTAKLMIATGLVDTLSKIKDETYERLKLNEDPRVEDLVKFDDKKLSLNGNLPPHRYYGYTMFCETDDFWRGELNKEPKDITAADIQKWVVDQGYYPEGKNNTDYSDENNVLNLFFTYHLLPMKLAEKKLVIHYNERGYDYHNTTMSYRTPTYELYTTMGKRRLLKIYQAGPNFSLDKDSKIYLNRFPVHDNGRHGNYKEVSVAAGNEGIVINTTGRTELVNAYIYPINKPLVYDENTRANLQRQRLRFDVASMFPEFMNNDLRGNRAKELQPGFPVDANYRYLDDAWIETGTRFYYLSGLDCNWNNWQGDEMNIKGRYEFTLRLPPVPKAGTYELRYAVQSNSSLRSMCQVYWGENRDNLPAMGIPLDLRMGGVTRRSTAGNMPSIVGWEADSNDDDYDAEVDKKMRNNDFMKGPVIYSFTPGGSNYARTSETTIRRIIVREYMSPDKVYYVKFKNVLDEEDKQHYMDYLEFCAKEVYDNPVEPEDIW